MLPCLVPELNQTFHRQERDFLTPEASEIRADDKDCQQFDVLSSFPCYVRSPVPFQQIQQTVNRLLAQAEVPSTNDTCPHLVTLQKSFKPPCSGRAS